MMYYCNQTVMKRKNNYKVKRVLIWRLDWPFAKSYLHCFIVWYPAQYGILIQAAHFKKILPRIFRLFRFVSGGPQILVAISSKQDEYFRWRRMVPIKSSTSLWRTFSNVAFSHFLPCQVEGLLRVTGWLLDFLKYMPGVSSLWLVSFLFEDLASLLLVKMDQIQGTAFPRLTFSRISFSIF